MKPVTCIYVVLGKYYAFRAEAEAAQAALLSAGFRDIHVGRYAIKDVEADRDFAMEGR